MTNSITDGEMRKVEETKTGRDPMIQQFIESGMTDLEKLKKTFTEIGQKYFVTIMGEFCASSQLQYDRVIKLDSGVGYAGFLCEFYFLNGKRVGHGVWE